MVINPEITTYLTGFFTLFLGLGLTMGFGRIFGRATTAYYHARNSLQIRLMNGERTSFADLCKSVMPPCNLNPFIFNGHLQTMWTVLQSEDIPVYYKRHIFENEDPIYTGSYAVDFVVRPYEGADPSLPERTTYFSDKEFDTIGSSDSKPMLVALHGLSGGSHELYLRHVLAPLISEQGGWEAIVVNSRGCAMSKITSSVLYNARATWDIRQTVKWLRKTFPNRPLFGVGFSLGANIITNYIGEEGADCVFKAALVLSNPWNLEAGSLALQRTWMGLNVYSRAMGNSMKALFESHAEQISKNPKIDVEAVRKIKYLHDFDREVQGPTWGYPTEGAYYRDAASTDSLLAVRIPFLAIHARDDPVAADEALPRHEVEETPYGVLCTTSLGGHLSWFELGGGRWFAKASTAYLQKMAREVDFNSIPHEDAALEGWVARQDRDPLRPVFQPTRRKLDLPTRS
jgi:predicted alpha/beta-fold hydrolase